MNEGLPAAASASYAHVENVYGLSKWLISAARFNEQVVMPYVFIQFISAHRVQLNDKRTTLYFNVPLRACATLVNYALMSIRHGYTSANKML